MAYNQDRAPSRERAVIFLVIFNVVIVKAAFVADENWYWVLSITIPLLLLDLVFKNIKRQVQMWSKKVENLLKLGIRRIPKIKAYPVKPHLSRQVVKSDGRIHHEM